MAVCIFCKASFGAGAHLGFHRACFVDQLGTNLLQDCERCINLGESSWKSGLVFAFLDYSFCKSCWKEKGGDIWTLPERCVILRMIYEAGIFDERLCVL